MVLVPYLVLVSANLDGLDLDAKHQYAMVSQQPTLPSVLEVLVLPTILVHALVQLDQTVTFQCATERTQQTQQFAQAKVSVLAITNVNVHQERLV